MTLFEGPRDPGPRELRRFGALWLPAFLVLAGIVLRRRLPPTAWIPAAPWGAAALSALLALAAPRALRPAYRALVAATRPVGRLLSWAVLAALWYLVITPVGLALRALGRDPLGGSGGGEESFWVEREESGGAERWFRQF